MARRKKAQASLPLFELTRERAWELVAKVPIGTRISSDMQTIRGKTYGPYYRAWVTTADGKSRKVHIGREQDLRELQRAWEIVGEELAAAERSADVRKLRALERRAGMIRGPRGVVSVPILDAREVASASRPK